MDLLKGKTKYFLFFGIFLLLWIFLFWKCRYGFPLDESFYILFCYRFMKGDLPVLHEWNPTQISALWLHPFVWVFYKIHDNSEQVLLTFRYIFTVIWGLSSLFLFIRLRKLSFTGAAVSSLIFLTFVPYGQLALYYNTFGLITVSSALVIVITAEKYKKVQYVIAGFLFAIAVTCCPFLLLLYFIFFVAAIVCAIKKNKELIVMFCCTTAGTIPAIIYFYIYYIAPSSLSEFIKGLPYLMADRQHQFTYAEKFIGFFKEIIVSSPLVLPMIFVALAALVYAILKKTKDARIGGFIAVCIAALILDISYLIKLDPTSNCFVFTPVFVGLYCGILCKSDKARKLFLYMWLPGLIYMFCINISSEIGFEAIVIPAVISTMASCFLCCFFINENTSDHKGLSKKLCTIAPSILALATIGIMMFGMGFYAFANGRVSTLTTKMEEGPNKGIYCSPEVYDSYATIVSDIEPLKDSKYENVLLLTTYWSYLDIEKKPALCSCFYPFIDDILLDQLEEYYELYPQFTPDVIYIAGKYSDLLPRVESYGYSGEETPNGGYILFRES